MLPSLDQILSFLKKKSLNSKPVGHMDANGLIAIFRFAMNYEYP